MIRIAPFPPTRLGELDPSCYDAVLGSLGFEARSREIPAALDSVVLRSTIVFRDRQEASFGTNERFFAKRRWDIIDIDEADEATWIWEWVARAAANDAVGRVAIDVSSMSRARIGAVVEAVADLDESVNLDVDLLYTPARYRDPDFAHDPPVLSVEPVSGAYAGWWSDLDAPLHAVIGVGYELERASSAIDHLEPETAEVFVPVGEDARFLSAVLKANRALFETHNVRRRTDYPVSDPFGCFHRLEATVFGMVASRRVALVPLGPKIFAACALLVGALHPESVQVIRVSARERQLAVDQHSDGMVYGIRLMAGRPRDLDARPEDEGSLSGLDVSHE